MTPTDPRVARPLPEPWKSIHSRLIKLGADILGQRYWGDPVEQPQKQDNALADLGMEARQIADRLSEALGDSVARAVTTDAQFDHVHFALYDALQLLAECADEIVPDKKLSELNDHFHMACTKKKWAPFINAWVGAINVLGGRHAIRCHCEWCSLAKARLSAFAAQANESPQRAEPASVQALPPLVRVLAEWEDKNGALAGILLEEWTALWHAVAMAAIEQSPRQLRAALAAHPSDQNHSG